MEKKLKWDDIPFVDPDDPIYSEGPSIVINPLRRRGPEADNQWKALVESDLDDQWSAEIAAEQERLGRKLTSAELTKIASKYADLAEEQARNKPSE